MDLPINVEHLTRTFGPHRGVTDLTFSVEPGEVFGFLGPNGAGKTTTIRQLMGMIKPTSGSAQIFGLDCWADATAVKALVGFLPGEIHLYERMTGQEFLDFFAAFRQGDNPRRERELAERLDVDLSRQIRHLSKGNRQKIGIIQALMHGAPLLILDEPSSGLDPLKQVDFLELLREERQRGTTIFLSSHLLVEVQRIADRVAIIREGELVAVEPMSRLTQLVPRRMPIILRDPVPAERFSALDGISVVSVDASGRHIELGVRGSVEPLLKLLAQLPVEDFAFGPADLESVFLHYYGTDAGGAEQPAWSDSANQPGLVAEPREVRR